MNRGLRLALGAHEQDCTAVGRDVADHGRVLIQAQHRLLEIDDVDSTAFREDVGTHLGIPAAGAVSEMYTGLQQFFHTDG